MLVVVQSRCAWIDALVASYLIQLEMNIHIVICVDLLAVDVLLYRHQKILYFLGRPPHHPRHRAQRERLKPL